MVHKENEALTNLLLVCVSTGVEKIEIKNNSYHARVTFQNGVAIRYWNCNKYYAWWESGEVLDSGNITAYEGFRWRNACPSKKAMRAFRKAVRKRFT